MASPKKKDVGATTGKLMDVFNRSVASQIERNQRSVNASRFWDLFAQSVIIQSVVTLLLVVAIVTIAIQGRDIPTFLVELGMLVFGYWFGTKNQTQQRMQYQDTIGQLTQAISTRQQTGSSKEDDCRDD